MRLDVLLAALPLPTIFIRVGCFLSVGVAGLAVDSGLFWLLYSGGKDAALARAVSLAIATLVTWWLNRLFTFAPSGRGMVHEALRYALVALVAQGFNYGLFLTLLQLANRTHPLLCLFASAVLTAALSFTGQSLFAFGQARRVSISQTASRSGSLSDKDFP
jgi:putative flippase GtrA